MGKQTLEEMREILGKMFQAAETAIQTYYINKLLEKVGELEEEVKEDDKLIIALYTELEENEINSNINIPMTEEEQIETAFERR